MKHSLLFVAAISLLPASLQADEVRYYDQDGVTYKETRRTVERPLVETRFEQRQKTVYTERVTTDLHTVQQSYQAPVVRYSWQPTIERSWNPFTPPYVVYRMTPSTTWETRTEQVRIPVARRELVPETRVENAPVTTQRVAKEEFVTRTAVGVAGTRTASLPQSPPVANSAVAPPITTAMREKTSTAAVARPAVDVSTDDRYGGVSRFDSEPLRATK